MSEINNQYVIYVKNFAQCFRCNPHMQCKKTAEYRYCNILTKLKSDSV